MLFSMSRVVLLLLVLASLLLIIRKTNIVRKKRAVLLAIIASICVSSATVVFPIENLFVNFKSPESVFNYTKSGRIADVVYGNDSCMVFYSPRTNAYSHSFVLAAKDGFKIPGYPFAKRVSHRQDRNGIFDVYRVLDTDDYYMIGLLGSDESEISILDEYGREVQSPIKKVENTSFIYCFLDGFTSKYYLLCNGDKIAFE